MGRPHTRIHMESIQAHSMTYALQSGGEDITPSPPHMRGLGGGGYGRNDLPGTSGSNAEQVRALQHVAFNMVKAAVDVAAAVRKLAADGIGLCLSEDLALKGLNFHLGVEEGRSLLRLVDATCLIMEHTGIGVGYVLRLAGGLLDQVLRTRRVDDFLLFHFAVGNTVAAGSKFSGDKPATSIVSKTAVEHGAEQNPDHDEEQQKPSPAHSALGIIHNKNLMKLVCI